MRDRNQIPPLKVQSTDYDGSILIIGAGAAGLQAAYTLEYLGVTNYQVVEAKSDIGGRIQEMNDFIDLPLDVGAEWIHTPPRVLQDMLLYEADQKAVRQESIIQYRPKTYRFQWLPQRLLRCNWLRFFYGEWKFETTTWYSYFRQYIYPYVAKQVHLNTAVESIDYSGDDNKVVVTTTKGDVYVVDKVIVAIPPSQLQRRAIQFVPPLPARQLKEIDKIDMRPGFKLWIEFDQQFYPDWTIMDLWVQRLYLDGVFRKPTERNVLILLCSGGPVTRRLVQLSDDELFKYVMKELDGLFSGQASRHYVQHRIKNWSKEPFIEGTWLEYENYSHKIIKKAIQNKVYLAGAYLDEPWCATVHGAACNGREVAQRILMDTGRATMK